MQEEAELVPKLWGQAVTHTAERIYAQGAICREGIRSVIRG